jgi:hypothetical protein
VRALSWVCRSDRAFWVDVRSARRVLRRSAVGAGEAVVGSFVGVLVGPRLEAWGFGEEGVEAVGWDENWSTVRSARAVSGLSC